MSFSVCLWFRKITRAAQKTGFSVSECSNEAAVAHLREKCAFQRRAGLKDPLYEGREDRDEEGNQLV